MDFTGQQFQDSMACNYKSAQKNCEDIERQVMEEVGRGSILRMSEEEAQGEFRGRLAVAALQGSSAVRIVHDGSYSVGINHRIKVLDRMRFPGIDDASGVMMYVDEQVERCPGLMRCSMLYDIARAHKLAPVARQDWGIKPSGSRGTSSKGISSYLQEERSALLQRPIIGSGWRLAWSGRFTGWEEENLDFCICCLQMTVG